MRPTPSPALLLLLLLATTGTLSHALPSPGWTPSAFPNPATNPTACGRSTRSWICDPDAVLSPNSRDVVEGLIKSISLGQQPFITRPCGSAGDVGPQLAVAVMQAFDPKLVQYQDVELVAASFANKLHDSWGVGHVQCNDGALLLLSIDDRQVYVSSGAGAGIYLTDRVLDKIIDGMKPLLRSKRFDEAVEGAVLAMGQALSSEAPKPQSPVVGWLITAAVVGGVGTLAWYLARKQHKEQRTFDECKAKLDKLKRDQALHRSGQVYNPTSCPICLEDFTPPPAAAAPASQAHSRDPEAASDAEVDGKPPPDEDEDVDGRPPSDAPSRQPLLGLQQRVRALGSAGEAGAGSSRGEGGGAAAAGAAAGAEPSRKPLSLPCKHQFCEACITQWVAQRKFSCPVCRKPIDEGPGDARSPPPPAPPCHDGAEAPPQDAFTRAYRGPYQGYNDQRYRQRGYDRQDLMRDELLFRLAMMRRRYPQYIDQNLVNQWSDDVAAGREVSPSAWNSFTLRDPAARAALAESGSRGASSGFGGGRSSGGRGSSW